jgi:hypothetical protein
MIEYFENNPSVILIIIGSFILLSVFLYISNQEIRRRRNNKTATDTNYSDQRPDFRIKASQLNKIDIYIITILIILASAYLFINFWPYSIGQAIEYGHNIFLNSLHSLFWGLGLIFIGMTSLSFNLIASIYLSFFGLKFKPKKRYTILFIAAYLIFALVFPPGLKEPFDPLRIFMAYLPGFYFIFLPQIISYLFIDIFFREVDSSPYKVVSDKLKLFGIRVAISVPACFLLLSLHIFLADLMNITPD